MLRVSEASSGGEHEKPEALIEKVLRKRAFSQTLMQGIATCRLSPGRGGT
jgi:hypothetical protein